MSCYVDPLYNTQPKKNWPYKRACHLFADSIEELHEMAGLVGVARSNLQYRADFPHYDLTANKRLQAIARGAVQVERDVMVDFVRKLRNKSELTDN